MWNVFEWVGVYAISVDGVISRRLIGCDLSFIVCSGGSRVGYMASGMLRYLSIELVSVVELCV